MAIDREFGPALLKAVRSLEPRGRGWLWEDPAWELADRAPADLRRSWRRPTRACGGWSRSCATAGPMPPRIAAATGHRSVVHRSARGDRRGRATARRASPLLERQAGADSATPRSRPSRRAAVARPARPGARRHRSVLPAGRHLRRRVPGRDAVLLLVATPSPRCAPPAERPQRDRRRLGTDPHRAGDRVRLLLGAGRVGDSRDGPRRGRDQQQPRDGLDRLRRLHAPLLRAARHRVACSTSSTTSER